MPIHGVHGMQNIEIIKKEMTTEIDGYETDKLVECSRSIQDFMSLLLR